MRTKHMVPQTSNVSLHSLHLSSFQTSCNWPDFFPAKKNFLKNSNYVWELLRITLQYFLLGCCINDYISITSFLWIRWTIWHWGEVSNFYSMQHLNLDDTIKYCNLAQYTKRSYFTAIDSSPFSSFPPSCLLPAYFLLFVKLPSWDLILQSMEQKRQIRVLLSITS